MKKVSKVYQVAVLGMFVLGFWGTVGDKITQFLEWTYNVTGGVGII